MCGGGGGGGGYTVAGTNGNPTYFGPAGTSRWVANAGIGAEGGTAEGYNGGDGGSGPKTKKKKKLSREETKYYLYSLIFKEKIKVCNTK